METLLTIPEVAKILKVGTSTVHRLIDEKELRAKVIGRNRVRRTIRIHPDWVEEYLAADVPLKAQKRTTKKKFEVNRY